MLIIFLFILLIVMGTGNTNQFSIRNQRVLSPWLRTLLWTDNTPYNYLQVLGLLYLKVPYKTEKKKKGLLYKAALPVIYFQFSFQTSAVWEGPDKYLNFWILLPTEPPSHLMKLYCYLTPGCNAVKCCMNKTRYDLVCTSNYLPTRQNKYFLMVPCTYI